MQIHDIPVVLSSNHPDHGQSGWFKGKGEKITCNNCVHNKPFPVDCSHPDRNKKKFKAMTMKECYKERKKIYQNCY